MAIDSFGDFTCYFRGAFFGRDAGSSEKTYRNGETKVFTWGAASGLTQWVANNFEVLNPGAKSPGDDRKVNQSNLSLIHI